MKKIFESVYLHQDTCNVYVIEVKNGLIVVHAGNGSVFDEIPSFFYGKKVIACLNTHHFRPTVQGLRIFEEHNADIYVPYWEQDMFAGTRGFWEERQTWINYDGRWDRYSLIESVKPTGYLMDYDRIKIDELVFKVIPTPGPTPGAVSLGLEVGRKKVIFTGDLIYGPGKVWNLASSQWNYNDAYGICHSIQSVREISTKGADILLPCHGKPMFLPQDALNKLEQNLITLLEYRARPEELDFIQAEQWNDLTKITDHLYLDKASDAQTFYLISESSKVLAIDYGYRSPFLPPTRQHFSTRRPLLHGIELLRNKFGIKKIDVVMPSHIHDDHVCGIPLLQRLFNTELWCAERFADLLENPYKYNVQCIWPEAMRVHRRIPFGKKFHWEEYVFVFHPSGAHTFYSTMIEFEVDGNRMIHTGDQQGFSNKIRRSDGFFHNYVYQNNMRREDMMNAAKLIRKIKPDFIISGHWETIEFSNDILRTLEKGGSEQIRIHESLLPIRDFDWNCDHIGAEIFPYHLEFSGKNQSQKIQVMIKNPFKKAKHGKVKITLPEGWRTIPIIHNILIKGLGQKMVEFTLTIPKKGPRLRRQPIAVDVTLEGHALGQIAEALVTVNWPEKTPWGGGSWVQI